MVTRENIRPEVPTSDDTIGREFKSRPPDGIDERTTLQPVRDCLLADFGDLSAGGWIETKVLPKLGSESSLVSDNLDGEFKSSNVVSIGHGHGKYTRNLVGVNKNPCLTLNKETCTVLAMPQTKRKPPEPRTKAVRRKRKTAPEVGPDGLTLSQRLGKLMTEMNVGQADVARMCSEYYATFHPGIEDRVKQQHIFNIINGQESSWVLPLVAYVFDVNDLWLQFGIGSKERRKH